MCVLSCWERLPFVAKRLSHTLHLNGFSPVCIRTCLVRLSFLPKVFPQNVHTKRRTVPAAGPGDEGTRPRVVRPSAEPAGCRGGDGHVLDD